MKILDKFFRSYPTQRLFIRSTFAERLLEDFFVSAVVSVLGIRLFLKLADYPQLGTGSIHIAHELWGGLFMVVALVILLGFINRASKEIAAIIGGIGFGTFIDEVGKFVTNNNDYFFDFTVALIYILFVTLYFSIRFIVKKQQYTEVECMANSFDIAKEASIHGLDRDEQQLAFDLLEQCRGLGSNGTRLKEIISDINPLHPAHTPFITRARSAVDRFYERAVNRNWFTSIVIGFFALASVSSIYALLALVQWSWAVALWLGAAVMVALAVWWSHRAIKFSGEIAYGAIVVISTLVGWGLLVNLKNQPLNVFDWGELIFPGISAGFVIAGLTALPRKRLTAYRRFRRAILVSIFFIQVLIFYEYQFLALGGLFINIAILLALRYMITYEETKLSMFHSEIIAHRDSSS